MVNNGFSTDLGAMQQTAGQVEDTYQQMVQALTQLQSDCHSIQGQWVGGAHDAFGVAMEHIDSVSKQMMNTLQGMGQNINTNMQKYHHGDESHQAMLAKAAGQVPSGGLPLSRSL
jgi:WXG100 family type VII secretion target